MLLICRNCNDNGPRYMGAGIQHYNVCEDCNGHGYVDEFYYQGSGTEPEGWKGASYDPTGDNARASLAAQDSHTEGWEVSDG